MSKELEMKKQIMEMLEKFLMGREGSKFAPKAVEVEVMHAKPIKGKEGLKEVLQDASDENPIEEAHESPEEEMDEDDEDKPKGMTLREFLESRS